MSRQGLGVRRGARRALVVTVCALGALTALPAVASADAQCPWMDASKTPAARAAELLGAMSLDEKLAMLYGSEPALWMHYGVAGHVAGNPELCIPDLVLNDAGNGVGDMEIGTTAYPVGIAQAASWDPALQSQFGHALGWEAWHKGINVQLAPNVNIARVPMNGRNFEGFGEDPYLVGQTAAAEIRGIQSNPVAATVKHFALNQQETNRMTSSSDVGERALREIYMPAFEAAVKQGKVGSVMCSYNRIDGVYACEQPATMNDVLKRDLRFDGWIMSDWGSTHSTVGSALAGMDMEMEVYNNGQYYGEPLKAAVLAGQVPMSRLDDMVRRILRTMFRIGIFEHPAAPQPQAFTAQVSTPENVALARTIASQGTVLLKNEGGILPLEGTGKTIAVIGQVAGPVGAMLAYGGGGSSHVPEAGYYPVVSPLEAIQRTALANGDRVIYADGTATQDAVAAATVADVAIVFANDAESEGVDRANLSLANGACSLFGCTPATSDQNALIAAVAQANPDTAVVLNTGGPVTMPWIDSVKAVLEAWYPGQEDGNAIAPILFGEVNPSGKLPQTFPRSEADLPTRTPQQYPGVSDAAGVPRVTYSEGLGVGYRWYDAQAIAPLFPFGHGLSYTTFRYSGLGVRRTATGASVSFTLANTGARTGAEVAQVYVGQPPAAGEPPRQLKGYQKVTLDPGQSRTVTIALDKRAFAHWETARHQWVVTAGTYRVEVGGSSRDLPLRGTVAMAASALGA